MDFLVSILQEVGAVKENVCFHIEEKYSNLRESEKKVADYLLLNMQRAKLFSIEELSEAVGVSQPTVVRFVKALGFKGYRDFKYYLVSELAGEEKKEVSAMYGYPIRRTDSIPDVPAKTIATTIQNLEDTLKCISSDTFEKVIDAIIHAKRIDFYGVENSGTTISDLVTKMLYLGINCRYFKDYYLQRICASSLEKGDVAIGISYSGCSKDTVDVMKIAKKRGAKTIIITNFENAKISEYADLKICMTHKQFLYGDAIFSRASQIAVVDMIYMGIILSDYDHYIKCLDKNSRLIQDKAYEIE